MGAAGTITAPDTPGADGDAVVAPVGTTEIVDPGSTGGRLGYVPGLDGMRGLAVIAVLLFHGGVSWATGGFLGVDVFFVLSGFLITTLLLEERARAGSIRLRAFWARRARRLLPALLVVVAVTGVFASLITPDGLDGFRKDAFATLGYVANWHFILARASYFERTAAPSPLRHTWSLAIEEQFYLVWPLIVLAVARGRRPLVKLGSLALVGAAASAVAMGVLFRPGHDASRLYYGTDTHAQVVLIGALVAVLLARRLARPVETRAVGVSRGVLHAGMVAGTAVVAVAVWRAGGATAWVYRGGFAAVAVATGLVIAHVVLLPSSAVARILAAWPLRTLGRISYGVYLWHWPLFLALTSARTGLHGPALLGFRMAVTLAVSAISYWCVELPVRDRSLFPTWQAAVALPIMVALAAVAVVTGTTGGISLASAASPRTPPTTEPAIALDGQHRTLRKPLAPGQPATVMFLGDSVSKTLADGLNAPAARAGLRIDNQAVLGCGIVRGGPYRYFGQVSAQLPQCEQWPKKWASLVARDDPDVVVLLVGRWEVMDRVHDGSWTRLGDPRFDAYLESELEQAVKVAGAKGAQIAMPTAPYYLRGERPDGGRWPEDDPARVDAFNALLRRVAARHRANVSVIEFGAHTSVGGRYTRSVSGINLRYDGVHFTPQADRWLAPWLFPQLLALAPPHLPGAAPSTTTPGRLAPTATTTPRRPTTTTTVRIPYADKTTVTIVVRNGRRTTTKKLVLDSRAV